VDAKDDQTLSAEVGKRLDMLFEDEDTSGAGAAGQPPDRTAATGKRLLEAVKADILSVDWEITDAAITALIERLTALKQVCASDKIALILIQMLISLGRYIKVRKSKAHVQSMNIMKSVFAGLEKILAQPDLPQDAKMKILRVQVSRFHDFQTQVMPAAARRRAKAPAVVQRTAEPVSPELQLLLQNLAEELKVVIRDEFRRLKEEIRSWRNPHDGYATG